MRGRYSPEPLRLHAGLLLSGCGHFDGSDVQEAVLSGLALDRVGAKVVALAPRRPQLHTADHTVGDEMEAPGRDALLESSRILHDKIYPLSEFPLETLQALVVPGGFGVAKNLMTSFAELGQVRRAHPDAGEAIRHFFRNRKPVGVIGLGDILVRHLTGEPLEDPRPGLDPAGIVVDRERRIVATPGFKSFTRVSEVAFGIDAMVAELIRLVREG
ncbi:MAG TPA: isoprenoid biosynthesis protein ElbB [Candidatus Polarisedimenticolia bacterium]|jgi:enhancing lycopene biosynthesis protein 2|nr:isoprenoid biosynthesis protein ElbB [Candidatus Polarisedimenticolia bacterium]